MTSHDVKHWIDWAAVGAALGSLTGFLPFIAAGLSAVWTILRLVEMVTGRTISQLLWHR